MLVFVMDVGLKTGLTCGCTEIKINKRGIRKINPSEACIGWIKASRRKIEKKEKGGIYTGLLEIGGGIG